MCLAAETLLLLFVSVGAQRRERRERLAHARMRTVVVRLHG